MKAPEKIPDELYDSYSMDGKITIDYHYRNDCSEQVQEQINANFTQEEFDKCIRKIKNKEWNYYHYTDAWLYLALEKYPIKGKHVCIAGSAYPWYEAMAIVHGASKCTVIEYSDRTSFHPDIEYIKPGEEQGRLFDACFSISSYEHDGLGRYGDPLNPNGDLEAMQNLKKILKKDALLYLSVPMGEDKVFFNVHRVYGLNRFPLLIKNWYGLTLFGGRQDIWTNNYNTAEETIYQPVHVLRNT
mgnify:CR=1 FL=1